MAGHNCINIVFLIFIDQGNSTSLGMEKGLILDGQITASSVYSTYRPATGRLNFGGWSPLTSENVDSWFQVDFETFTTVTSIFTQGHRSTSYWVKTFFLSFSNDGINFQDYLEFGKPKVISPRRRF